MRNLIFIGFFIAIIGVLAVVMTADTNTLQKFSDLPIIGHTIKMDSDARSSITNAQRGLRKGSSGTLDPSKVVEWEDKYKESLGAIDFSIIKKGAGSGKNMRDRFVGDGLTGDIIIIDPEDDYPNPLEVFLIAIVSDGLEWQKRIGVINASTIVENPAHDVTIWIEATPGAAKDVYNDFIEDKPKSEVYAKVISYAMEGEIQISPYNQFVKFALQYIQ